MLRVLLVFSAQLLAVVLAGSPPKVSEHKNLGLLPKSCGRAILSSRIKHDINAGPFEFPWMARFVYDGDFRCAGSIINERYILTAAHCLMDTEQKLVSIRVGETNSNKGNKMRAVSSQNFQNLQVEKVIPHENYNPKTSENDIGLVRVPRMDLTKENARPVCLPLAQIEEEDFFKKQTILAGWGITEDGGRTGLLKTRLDFTDIPFCRTFYKGLYDTPVDNRQICAGGIGYACNVERGSPLHVNQTIDGHSAMVQHGIVSIGPNKCHARFNPKLFTRVTMFMDWILNNLED